MNHTGVTSGLPLALDVAQNAGSGSLAEERADFRIGNRSHAITLVNRRPAGFPAPELASVQAMRTRRRAWQRARAQLHPCPFNALLPQRRYQPLPGLDGERQRSAVAVCGVPHLDRSMAAGGLYALAAVARLSEWTYASRP